MYGVTKLAFTKEWRTVSNIDITDMCLWVKWMKTAELKNIFIETHAFVWMCVCVCVTAHNWANDAGILLGTWHSILTQVAKMAEDCKNSCMCWLRSEYRMLWMWVSTFRKSIRETHSSLCSFIFIQNQSLSWGDGDSLLLGKTHRVQLLSSCQFVWLHLTVARLLICIALQRNCLVENSIE